MKYILLFTILIVLLNLFTNVKIHQSTDKINKSSFIEAGVRDDDENDENSENPENNENDHEENAIEEEKNLDKLDQEVEDALEHEDLNEMENHQDKENDSLNNEADEETKVIEKELNEQNGVKDEEEDDNDLEID